MRSRKRWTGCGRNISLFLPIVRRFMALGAFYHQEKKQALDLITFSPGVRGRDSDSGECE